jgi:uncharacterized protein
MDTKRIQKPLKKFLAAIPRGVKIEKVVLFGSVVRKDADTASDIDVFIVSDSFKGWDEDKRLDVLYKASRFIDPEIHPWAVTSSEWEKASNLSILGQARKTGVVMHG